MKYNITKICSNRKSVRHPLRLDQWVRVNQVFGAIVRSVANVCWGRRGKAQASSSAGSSACSSAPKVPANQRPLLEFSSSWQLSANHTYPRSIPVWGRVGTGDLRTRPCWNSNDFLEIIKGSCRRTEDRVVLTTQLWKPSVSRIHFLGPPQNSLDSLQLSSPGPLGFAGSLRTPKDPYKGPYVSYVCFSASEIKTELRGFAGPLTGVMLRNLDSHVAASFFPGGLVG